jgi:hypothetical protein
MEMGSGAVLEIIVRPLPHRRGLAGANDQEMPVADRRESSGWILID